MKLKTLSGSFVHPIGIGTWGIGGTWEAVYGNEAEGIDAIRYSINRGQNHIDSGEIYGSGHTDEIIGEAIKGLDRKKLFIADKVWETSVGRGRVRPAVNTMLKKLGTNYLDLLYIHKPWQDFPWREAVEQINDLIDKGIVRSFGVSNFNIQQLQEAIKLSKHPIVANQLHYNVLFRDDVSPAMLSFCKKNDIQIIAYRPLEQSKVIENEIIKKIAIIHKVKPAQVALAWVLSHNALPIPGAFAKELIDQNIASTKLKLSPEELKQLEAL